MQLTQVPSGLISRDHALLVASLLYIGLLALACLVPDAGAPLRTAAPLLWIVHAAVVRVQHVVHQVTTG